MPSASVAWTMTGVHTDSSITDSTHSFFPSTSIVWNLLALTMPVQCELHLGATVFVTLLFWLALNKLVRRLQFCDKETQLKYFRAQFQLAAATKLPMFLHLRAAAQDFLEVLREQQGKMSAGVVHSFDGSAAELQSLLDFSNIYIGAHSSLSFIPNLCTQNMCDTL